MSVELDLRDLDAGIRGMLEAAKDLRPAYRLLRKPLRQDQKRHFDWREGPSGTWAPRAPASVAKLLSRGGRRKNYTKKGRVRKGAARRLGNQLGRLKTALKVRMTKAELSIASKVSWAEVQFFGGTAGRGVTIPARPFLWISAELEAEARELLLERVVKGFDR